MLSTLAQTSQLSHSFAILPILFIVAYVAVLIFIVMLMSRFVRAVEKIATGIEKIQLPKPNDNASAQPITNADQNAE